MWRCELCDVWCPSEYQKVEHITGQKHCSKLAAIEKRDDTPSCKCGVECAEKTVVKDGPNKGRRFYCCYKPQGSGCGYFEFADVDKSISRSKSKPQQLPDNLRNIFSTKRNVNIVIQTDPARNPPKRLTISFAYCEKLVGVIKAHLSGRRWDGDAKQWIVEEPGIVNAVALFVHLGLHVAETVQREAELLIGIQGNNSADSIKFILLGDLVTVEFAYDAEIVSIVKQLHPRHRQYVADNKNWVCALAAIPELLESLAEALKIALPPTLNTLLEKSKLREQQREAAEAEARAKEEAEIEARIALEVQKVRQYHKDSSIFPSKKRTHEVIDLTNSSSHPIDLSSGWLRRALEDPQRTAVDPNSAWLRSLQRAHLDKKPKKPINCDCGLPYKFIVNGEHVCRYYGSFECKKCTNRWTSAYTWKGEKQNCRKCNTENDPWRKEPLQKKEGESSINGPHDQARCGMCKKQGRPCNLSY